MRRKIHLTASTLRGLVAGTALSLSALLLLGYAPASIAGESNQAATFKSAEEASQTLLLAVQSHDQQALNHILGAGRELVSSDDEVLDKLDRERFAQKYQEMHRLVREPHGDMLLYIGAENWPFPIPLVSRNGAWRFDSDAGMQEIRYRRIGENEVTAIAICHTLIAAEKDPKLADGLTDAVLASVKSGNKAVAFHGYYFHVLPRSRGGVAAIAYPVAYRSSGVMTFMINEDDVARERDLGLHTAELAGAIAGYDVDSAWKPAEMP
ncbi:MAG TPA: DUF2950 family protein [Steroidobacteraceae bacterium]|jgi:hypothetical protein|nr:DUF2950 family protein [Steroidobacteraceae bacterium]